MFELQYATSTTTQGFYMHEEGLTFSFKESRDNWGTLYPPEDKDPPEFGEELDREEQYRVSADWLYETDDYNEIMPEEDFEVSLSRHFISTVPH